MNIDVTPQKTQADWYYMNKIDQMNLAIGCQKSYYSLSGSNSLVSTNTPSVGHGIFQIDLMGQCGRLASLNSLSNPIVVGAYPNPTLDEISIIVMNSNGLVNNWVFVDNLGKEFMITPIISELKGNQRLLHFDLKNLPKAEYLLKNRNLNLSKIKIVKN